MTNESTNKPKKRLKRKKIIKTNTNENIIVQNLWDIAKEILRGKFIAIQKLETRKISNKQSNLLPKGTREKENKANPR